MHHGLSYRYSSLSTRCVATYLGAYLLWVSTYLGSTSYICPDTHSITRYHKSYFVPTTDLRSS